MADLPRPQIKTARDPGINLNIEPDTDFLPKNPLAENQELLYNSVNKALKDDHLNYPSYQGIKQKYEGSELQIKKYEDLKNTDPLFADYISQKYGSYENFLFVNRMNENQAQVFDPMSDYKMEVTVITKNVYYKSDHISGQEIILEALSGLCTVDYLSVDGSAKRLYGTLQKRYMIPSMATQRFQFFSTKSGKYGEKVILWNVNKMKWSSFYMNRALRFVKDDTTGIE